MNQIFKKLTIMIVEDEAEVRKLMQNILSDKFSNVITAQNGDEGVKKFKKYNPDIVVTDIAMPIMDGLDMAQQIKQISHDTPIMAISAHSEKEKLLKAIDVGIDKYILKPIDMDEFLSVLEHIVNLKIDATNTIKLSNVYSFDKTKRVLVKNNTEIPLTKKELSFVSLLVKRLGTTVLHDEIKNVVWIGESVSDAAIRTFVKRIRDKVGAELVKNIPGLGYKIDIKS